MAVTSIDKADVCAKMTIFRNVGHIDAGIEIVPVKELVRELVLDDPGPFVPFILMKERREVDYEAKAVKLAGRRYIVCRNLDEMSKDAANRATIVAALERQLKKGDKSLVGNKGYRRFLANPQGDGFSIDRAKVEEDAKFDGVFVLQTNANLSALEARRCGPALG